MRTKETTAQVEGAARRQRGQVLHEMAVAAIAWRPDSDAAKVTAALRTLGYSAAADAHENTRWEASFCRSTVTPFRSRA